MQTLGHVGRIIHGPRSSKLRVRCMHTIPWKQSISLTLVSRIWLSHHDALKNSSMMLGRNLSKEFAL